MKKLFAMLLAVLTVVSLVACGNTVAPAATTTAPSTGEVTEPSAEVTEPSAEVTVPTATVEVMTYAEYMAAELDAAVTVEFYVQGAQGWWFDTSVNHGKITVYGQDNDGGYFAYELKCEEADAAKLTVGTKIRVSGFKGEWAGEVEIMDGTFEFVEGSDTFVAEPLDVTNLLGTEDLIKHQNEKVAFKGLTIDKIEYKNGEPGDDIYVTVKLGEATYDFCVEMYLTGPDTDVYKAFAELKAGDVVDMEGFLYWYEGVNTHITAVAKAA